MNVKNIVLRVLTYCGYAISVLNVALRWFLMGFPCGIGLVVGYWGGTTYSDELGKRFLEIDNFEQLGIARTLALPLNDVLSYLNLAIITTLVITLIMWIYAVVKLGKLNKSCGNLVTGIMS